MLQNFIRKSSSKLPLFNILFMNLHTRITPIHVFNHKNNEKSAKYESHVTCRCNLITRMNAQNSELHSAMKFY